MRVFHDEQHRQGAWAFMGLCPLRHGVNSSISMWQGRGGREKRGPKRTWESDVKEGPRVLCSEVWLSCSRYSRGQTLISMGII